MRGEDWRSHRLQTAEEIGSLLDRTRVVAVLGMKTDDDPDEPAWFVPEHVKRAGLRVINDEAVVTVRRSTRRL